MITETYIKVKVGIKHIGTIPVKEIIDAVFLDITYPDKNEAEIVSWDIVECDVEE